jgi:hypothetical protein
MKNYIVYNEDGIIIRTGQCDDNIIGTLFIEEGYTILEGVADINTQYVVNNEIISLSSTEIAEKTTYKYGYVWDRVSRVLVKSSTDEEIAAHLSEQARIKRDRLLLNCDWTQTSDQNESTKLLWQPYRQALRDITEQQGFPNIINWPVKPT